METWWQDLRFGARSLLRNPAVAALGLLTLALGIGANTAIFSIVDGVLLKPLPFLQPERIVPFTYALVLFVLVAVALFANWLPARRATHADPLAALRSQ
jgi:ABC-type antimicrobial peptide transport system permease subunit